MPVKGNEYECICKTEFYNKFGELTCFVSVFVLQNDNIFISEIKTSKAECLSAVCKTCEQKCNYDSANKKYSCSCETGYTLEESTGKCTPGDTIDTTKCKSNQTNTELPPAFLEKGYCTCLKGFRFNGTSKLCNVDQSLGNQFGCPKVELKTDSQPGCVCLEGQLFDAASRQCLAQCTEERTKECNARGAGCQVTGDKVQCQCAPGYVPLAENGDNLDKATCVDKCQLLEKYPKYAFSK